MSQPTCASHGCAAVSTVEFNRCLAHLSSIELDRALSELHPGSDVDFSGVSFSEDLLSRVLEQLVDRTAEPRFRSRSLGPPTFGDAIFKHARFLGRAKFSNSRFTKGASFNGATFEGSAYFTNAEFLRKRARFDDATFSGEVDFGGARFMKGGRFEGVLFNKGVTFTEARFDDVAHMRATYQRASFRHALFLGDAWFKEAKFVDAAVFDAAIFERYAHFGGGTFEGYAGFSEVNFGLVADFEDSRFRGNAWFGHAQFGQRPVFQLSEFAKQVSFSRARFVEGAHFRAARFTGEAVFSDVSFGASGADFSFATFSDGSHLGPCESPELVMDRARFGKDVLVHCRLERLEASQVRCPDGINLQIVGAIHIDASKIYSPSELTVRYVQGALTIADAAFGSPAIVARAIKENPALSSADEKSAAAAPSLLSLTRVDATNLTLSGIDMRSCRFLATYNLDQLRIDGPPLLPEPPRGRRRWTRRSVLAEEHIWRASYDRRPNGWFPAECRNYGERIPKHSPADRRSAEARHQAARIQTAYRDLRKGREDLADEPGSADFYYGEMEMRRLAAPSSSVERTLLTSYWLISGYGLRATRALWSLLVLICLGSLFFLSFGFAPSTHIEYRPITGKSLGQTVAIQQVNVPGARPGWTSALDQSAESTLLSFRSPPPRPLTASGRVVEITLRLLGPVFLGLAVFAVRGRVKR